MQTYPTILASTWSDGLYVLSDQGLTHEFANQSVRGLSDDLNGGVLASVDGKSLFQRNAQGEWNLLARCEHDISVTFAVDGKVFVGTDNAQIWALDEERKLRQIDNFDVIDGRASWFAGTAIVDGKEVGPPLGVRSLHGANGGKLFANVHVGGIPRSMDGGGTWSPTIDVNLDAHQVCVDSRNSDCVVAASAEGLCISYDGGKTWSVHTEGLHAKYCSGVDIVGQTIFVAASEHHFSPQGAIYRRTLEQGEQALEKVTGGLPDWLDGIVDTSCIASRNDWMALVTARGSIYASEDAGCGWTKREETLPGVSSVVLL
ncbi:MAG: WD40/YVTN/BNR-like repeat-containing protein [Lysobacterales bacterium]